jgi:serine/threonine protein kinase
LTGYPRQYGKYVLLEPIGAGGMSEVDLAHRGVDDTSFVRFVAIKRVARSNLADESYSRMFMDEARINAELHHGNIVGVYDFGKQVDPTTGREEYFMVMEYVPGLDLRALQRAAHQLGHRLPLCSTTCSRVCSTPTPRPTPSVAP